MDIVGNLINWIPSKCVLLYTYHTEQPDTQLLTNGSELVCVASISELVEIEASGLVEVRKSNKRAAASLLEACYMLVRFMCKLFILKY